jgi:hypothetical protein
MADISIQDFSLQLGGGKGFFSLKLSDQNWTNWVLVSPAELAAIAIFLQSGSAIYDFDKGVFKIPPRGVHGIRGESYPPSLNFDSSNYPKKSSK